MKMNTQHYTKLWNTIKVVLRVTSSKRPRGKNQGTDTNKAKPNPNSINKSISKNLGFTHNLLDSSKGLGSLLRLCPLQHTACLLGSRWLHSTNAVLGGL